MRLSCIIAATTVEWCNTAQRKTVDMARRLVLLLSCFAAVIVQVEAPGCEAGFYGSGWGAGQSETYCDPNTPYTHDYSATTLELCKANCVARGAAACGGVFWTVGIGNGCVWCAPGYSTASEGDCTLYAYKGCEPCRPGAPPPPTSPRPAPPYLVVIIPILFPLLSPLSDQWTLSTQSILIIYPFAGHPPPLFLRAARCVGRGRCSSALSFFAIHTFVRLTLALFSDLYEPSRRRPQ